MQKFLKGVVNIRYYESWKLNDKGVIYSVDMVRLSVEFRQDSIEIVRNRLCSSSRLDVTIYGSNFGYKKYRNLIVIEVGESTVSIGIGLNGSKEDNLKGFIEFNPNKVFPEWLEEFWFIRSCCSDVKCKKFDIAIDIPLARRFVHLLKDSRLYETSQKSKDDFTEYLGRRNQPGRVKLYNKTIESGLEDDLTRLEITSELSLNDLLSHVPKVEIVEDFHQLTLDEMEYYGLKDNDIVLVDLLNELDYEAKQRYFKRLTYHIRKKIEPFVFGRYKRFDVNVDICRAIIELVKEICK